MKVYKLKKSNSQSYNIATKHKSQRPLLKMCFDKDKNPIQKELRYATNMNSPYVEEQNGVCVFAPIVFENGYLKVQDNDIPLINFLEATPDNGRIFEEVNYEKNAKNELEVFELEDKAIGIYKDLSDEQIDILYSRITEGRGRANAHLVKRKEVRKFLRTNPEKFISLSQAKDLLFRGTVETFFELGMLKLGRPSGESTPVKYNIADDTSIMCRVLKDDDYVDQVITFLQSEIGREALTRLTKSEEK